MSARLLVLTIFFVMLSEIFIYAPSIARYRKVYLEDRIANAHLATLTLDATSDHMIDPELAEEVLDQARARKIVIHEPGEPKKMLMVADTPPPDLEVDIRDQNLVDYLLGGFDTLFQADNRVVRIVGPSPHDAEVLLDVWIDETPMRLDMYQYSTRILQLSLLIAAFTAALVYISLQLLLVFPMRRMTENIVRFRDDPEDQSASIRPSERSDEIGIAERVLADMQDSLRHSLRQKTHLAALGAAVTKINHDLRNILTPAQLLSDRLVASGDPEVKRIAPRLVSAIDRAVDLCVQTLSFASESGPRLNVERFDLRALVDEAGQTVTALNAEDAFDWINDVAPGTELTADRAQIYRVLVNLGRNAAEAGARRVAIDARIGEETVVLDIADDGPGLPAAARHRLFQPFSGSARPGGTGLGLAISDELVRAHGGAITLVESGPEGTRFRIELPVKARPAAAA